MHPGICQGTQLSRKRAILPAEIGIPVRACLPALKNVPGHGSKSGPELDRRVLMRFEIPACTRC
jgi:hypothetical protein